MAVAPVIGDGVEDFDINKMPLWAIPQLAFIMRVFTSDSGYRDTRFTAFQYVPDSIAYRDSVLYMDMTVAGVDKYLFVIKKADMNTPVFPTFEKLN